MRARMSELLDEAEPGADAPHDVAPGDDAAGAGEERPATTAAPTADRLVRSAPPWDRQRVWTWIVRVALVGLSTFIALRVVQPGLLIKINTPTGGDMGAHVWGPAYLRDHLLPEWRLNGWTMDWYSGFPIYRFYMVVPALLIVLLDVVLPYGVAFKLVAVLGIVTLPIALYAFGRLARFAYPLPELFAVVGLIYLLDESYTIYGGNVASTMAGEFSFSIALSLAMLGFGLFARGLETGEHRVKAAITIALAVLCHGIVAIFVTVGLLIMGLLWLDRTRFRWFVTTAGTGALLSAFWIVPFLGNHAYMTDMKYKGEPGSGSFTSFWDMFFALPPFFNVLFTGLAIVGFVASIVRRQLTGTWLGVTGLVFAALVFLTKDSLPVIGLLWNPRLLPFVNMCRYLLAAVGAVEIVWAVVRWAQLERFRREVVRAGGVATAPGVGPIDRGGQFVASTATALSLTVVALVVLGFRFQVLPGGSFEVENGRNEYTWLGIIEGPADAGGFVDGWARWNFSGYEGKAYYGEYYDVVQTMKAIGAERGCGRALWENYGDNDRYGTTMALMLLPFWTDGCIGSSEGLFFEAAGTTPYHFLAAAAMSKQSSNPVRELRYDNNDAAVGVPYLQDLGMRYYLAVTPEAIAQAEAQPELTLIDTAGPWHIYEVAGGDIVVPLTVQPVVVEGRSGDQRERWLEVGTSWFQQREEWAAIPAADGPEDWQRIPVEVDLGRRVGEPGDDSRNVDIVVPGEPIEPVALPEVQVSDVVVGDDSVSFSVDRPGVPVLVRVSYFPNWKVDGAEGPYRVAPNMMVVVPTDTEVRLHFDSSAMDWLAYVLTLLGVVACFVLWRRGPVQHASPRPGGLGPPPGDEPAEPQAEGGNAAGTTADPQSPTTEVIDEPERPEDWIDAQLLPPPEGGAR